MTDRARNEERPVAETRERTAGEQSVLRQDGSIHIRELVMAPSELLSAEYKEFQRRTASEVAANPALPIPSKTAPRSEWDHFYAWYDRRYNSEPLRQLLQLYPVEVVETRVAGVRAAVITARGDVARKSTRRILINAHGGGFVYNPGLTFGQIESIPIAAMSGITVVTLDYRQAPFNNYPAATEDVVAVYRELLQTYSADAIGIFGCSAGGMLAAQAVSWFRTTGLPRPAAVGMFYIAPMPPCERPPWGRGWGESGMWFSGVPKTEVSEADQAFWGPVRWYMETADDGDERAYPGLSDSVLTSFPATLFVSGTRDYTMSSVVFSHARLLRLGVDSSLYILEGCGHGAHLVAVGTSEARDVNTYIARWFDQRLAK